MPFITEELFLKKFQKLHKLMWFCATWYRLSGIKPLLVGLLFCLLLNVICILFYRYSIMEMPASQHKNYGIYITFSFPFALSTVSLPAEWL